MCSLMISGAIYLMVKVDATDEIFTKSIIPPQKKEKRKCPSQPPAGCTALRYLADFDSALDSCPLMSWKHSNY